MRTRGQREQVDPTVQAARITRRGSFAIAAGTVTAAFVAGIFAAYKVGNDQGASAATPPTVTVVKTVTTTGTAPAPSPSSPANDAPAASDVSAQVRLSGGMGVDIDATNPRPVETSGPNGDIDLYFNGTALAATRSALFYYYGTEADAKVGCANAVKNNRSVPGPTIVSAGGQLCLRTSKGTIGWVSCNDVKLGDSGTGYMVLNYRLFN